jgi:hypothetical protein
MLVSGQLLLLRPAQPVHRQLHVMARIKLSGLLEATVESE